MGQKDRAIPMFILTSFGVPGLAESLLPLRPNRKAALAKTWLRCKAFDESSRFEPVPEKAPEFSGLQRFLTHTFYNPREKTEILWRRTGDCQLSEIRSEIREGLQHDDDVIQQWLGAKDIIILLDSATTFRRMIDVVRCINGEFETDPELQRLMADVLGPRS